MMMVMMMAMMKVCMDEGAERTEEELETPTDVETIRIFCTSVCEIFFFIPMHIFVTRKYWQGKIFFYLRMGLHLFFEKERVRKSFE